MITSDECYNYRFDREANEDVEIDGVCIPQGVTVIAMAYAIHYNPKYWSQPEKYNPDRCCRYNTIINLFHLTSYSPMQV